MWKEMARIVSEVRPRFVFVENSPMLTSRGLGVVLGDLATLGYDAEWGVISAADTGAPHLRERIWIVAHAICSQKHGIRRTCEQGRNALGWDWKTTQQNNGEASSNSISGCNQSQTKLADSKSVRSQGKRAGWEQKPQSHDRKRLSVRCRKTGKYAAWPLEPNAGRVANGVAARVDRLKAIGNGQVPRVAATAFELLNETN